MISPIEKHSDEIAVLCRKFGIARLEPFGSAATEAYGPDRSDVHILVGYPAGYDFGP
jgi:predicted nucleotidyltransferase